jgi:hypothetical protein
MKRRRAPLRFCRPAAVVDPVEAARAAGIEAERARLQSLDDFEVSGSYWDLPDLHWLVQMAKYVWFVAPPDLALEIVQRSGGQLVPAHDELSARRRK